VYVGGMSFKGGPASTEVAAYWRDGVEHDMTDTGVAYGYQPQVPRYPASWWPGRMSMRVGMRS
jgi:hypothetical protein